MRDGIGIVRSVVVHDHVAAGKGPECERLNELASPLCHGYAHDAAGPLQAAKHLGSFVAGDATGHAESYLLSREFHVERLIRHILPGVIALTGWKNECNIENTAA